MLGKELKEYRNCTGLKRGAFCDMINISIAMLKMYESERCKIHEELASRIINATCLISGVLIKIKDGSLK